MELTEEDVLEILKLFEQSQFDFLQLEQGERRITVSKGGYVPTAAGGTRAATSSSSSVASAGAAATNAAASAPQPEAKPATSSIPAGLVAVTAPMVGKFYSAPAPSDPPCMPSSTVVSNGWPFRSVPRSRDAGRGSALARTSSRTSRSTP